MSKGKTERVIDKSEWGDGPWQQEPDRAEWRDEVTGYPCMAIRNSVSGSWCGYVAVAPGHPFHGKDYNDLDLAVHGGLSYSAKCLGGICHEPADGEPDNIWWLGFDCAPVDCAHSYDFAPRLDALIRAISDYPYPATMFEGATYKTLDFIKDECSDLASQIFAAAKK